MASLPIHVDIWGNHKGIFKVALRPSDKFSFTEHGKSFPETGAWLKAYLEKTKWPLPPLDFSDLTPFTLDVLEALKGIPFGRAASYADIAKKVGVGEGARAVGRACGANPLPLFIPCHRVILSDGGLGGYAFGSEVKKQLLDFEGVKISF